ncbi:MAG: phosphate acyltransferase PlsX [Dehalococcoidales bacterium]|nr:phosphate acyltransferase PlsX [Dehalococcoidales bacterium]
MAEIKISVDAMGGDYAPGDIIKGSVMGAREHNTGIILVGPRTRIEEELAKHDTAGLDIEIVHTDEYLIEGEPPAYALRTKRNASIALATRLVREGRAQAVLGVGPTGGVLTSALMYLGTLEGIARPIVGGQFCGLIPKMVLMDMGGNIDARPEQYIDFAVIGVIYAKKLMGIPDPTVGLVSVGAEEGKGNAVTREAYPLLKQSGLNFIGNVEGNDIAAGKANVVVCDASIGNVVVKYTEGLGTAISTWLREELKGHLPEDKINALSEKLLRLTVPADTQGGGPLWAVNGVVFKAHGRSQYPQVANTIGEIKRFVEMDVLGALKEEFARVKNNIKLAGTGLN